MWTPCTGAPLAAKNGWAKNHERDSLTGIDGLPAGVERLVIGAQISPTTLDAAWRVGVCHAHGHEFVATRGGGRRDNRRTRRPAGRVVPAEVLLRYARTANRWCDAPGEPPGVCPLAALQ